MMIDEKENSNSITATKHEKAYTHLSKYLCYSAPFQSHLNIFDCIVRTIERPFKVCRQVQSAYHFYFAQRKNIDFVKEVIFRPCTTTASLFRLKAMKKMFKCMHKILCFKKR